MIPIILHTLKIYIETRPITFNILFEAEGLLL